MKYSLVVHKVTNNIYDNMNRILEYINVSSRNGSDFVLFPECSITGLQNNDIKEHDLVLGLHDKSEYIQLICDCAQKNEIFVSIGFLEREKDSLYDSVMCIDKSGKIIAKYRRISNGWHGLNADREVYLHGETIATFYINKLKYSWLICGDLFDDTLVEKIRTENVDILLFPFARTMDRAGEISQKRWDSEEMPHYVEQIKKTGATVLMNNYISESQSLDEYFFGGAFVVTRDGQVLSKMEIEKEGILSIDSSILY